MRLQVITSEEQHEDSLAEIDRLILANPPAGSQEADRLSVLGVLVETYERSHFPIEKPTPVEAIRFRMEQQGLTPRDLERYIGSRSKVSEVLAEKVPLSLRMIRELHAGLGIPAEVLLQDRSASPSGDDAWNWERFPVRAMWKRGWFEATEKQVRADPGALARVFISHSIGDAASVPLFRRSLHERTKARTDAFYALLAWTARVRQRAELIRDMPDYVPASITPETLRAVARLSAHVDGPTAVCAYLQTLGVATIVEPHLPKTKLDGAALLLSSGRPVIGLTLRYDRTDHFWFTLMHELIHVQRHLTAGGTDAYLDDLDLEPGEDPIEAEADRLAGEALIPRSVWPRSAAFRERTAEAIFALAKQLEIHPAIVAGRLQRETKNFYLFSQMVGHRQVRRMFGLAAAAASEEDADE